MHAYQISLQDDKESSGEDAMTGKVPFTLKVAACGLERRVFPAAPILSTNHHIAATRGWLIASLNYRKTPSINSTQGEES
jgi:hypothetical protein